MAMHLSTYLRKVKSTLSLFSLFFIAFLSKSYSRSNLTAHVPNHIFNNMSSEYILSDSIRSNALFDFDNGSIRSLLTIIKNEPGDLLQTSKRKEHVITVNLFYERSTPPNPLKIASDYAITLQANGETSIEMKEAIPLELMHISEALAVLYEGQSLVYPKTIHVNDTLPSASGKLKLIRKIDDTSFLTYEVAVKNRKILRKESIEINGQELEAYIHAYNMEINVKSGGITYLIRTEEVLEWLVPKYGIIKQERRGKEIKPNGLENEKWEHQRIQSIKSLN